MAKRQIPGKRPRKSLSKASGLTHFDSQGQARMVDVSPKPETQRKAVASAQVLMRPATAKLIAKGEMSKGDIDLLMGGD